MVALGALGPLWGRCGGPEARWGAVAALGALGPLGRVAGGVARLGLPAASIPGGPGRWGCAGRLAWRDGRGPDRKRAGRAGRG